MTNEQAKSELMHIYMSLSEEKKKALDVLMAQADEEHDGCKDCVYQDNPQDAMPCRECKQNYMDKWKAIPSAEPYKGMTKGEVIMAVKGEAKVIDNKGYKLITFTDDWWNSPYEPQESEG